MTALFHAAGFFWRATAGHRLRPWRSPYLRWRMETYTGKPAGALKVKDFFALAWHERRQMMAFFRWTGELRMLAGERKN